MVYLILSKKEKKNETISAVNWGRKTTGIYFLKFLFIKKKLLRIDEGCLKVMFPILYERFMQR